MTKFLPVFIESSIRLHVAAVTGRVVLIRSYCIRSLANIPIERLAWQKLLNSFEESLPIRINFLMNNKPRNTKSVRAPGAETSCPQLFDLRSKSETIPSTA